MSRAAVVAAARALIGTKWRHRGRTDRALDCAGLVALALERGGVPVADRIDYGREPWRDGLRRTLRAHFGTPIDPAQWGSGDVALMRLPKQPAPSHLGILAHGPGGDQHIIHCHSRYGVAEHRVGGMKFFRVVEIYSPWAG